MFEIHTDDGIDVVLAVAHTVSAALAATRRIAEENARQLAANGEGHSRYRLRLAIRDMTTGEDVAWAAVAT